MRHQNRVRPLLLCALFVFVAACGSSVSMGGGIGGTSSVVGAISGFGSIIVGGIEFDTSNAQVIIDGSPAPASDLKLGMVAVVRGTVEPGRARGVADMVTSDDLLEGPLERIDVPGMTFRALSQDVVADADTVFEPLPLAGLSLNDIVQVSGFLDANGRIRATRVERKSPDVEIEVKGYVQQLDAAASTFRINALIVDFTGASIEGAPAGGLANGLFVEVQGEGPPEGDVLTAVGVEVLDPSLMTDVGDGLKVEGFVTALISPDEVVVNQSQHVRVTRDTRFENGSASDLVLNAQVDVTGVAAADGALVASEVEFIE